MRTLSSPVVMSLRSTVATALVLASASACHHAAIAQEPATGPGAAEWVTLSPNGRISTSAPRRATEDAGYTFRSRKDSLAWVAARRVADRASEFRVVVSVLDRQLWVIDEYGDTLRTADAAVAKDEKLEYGGRSWSFETPRGRHTVRSKAENPVWTPPDWHYAEVARDYGLKLRHLPLKGSVTLKNGAQLSVRDSVVGIRKKGEEWEPLPIDYEVVFDGTLYVPPIGTKNRRIEGQLGRYKLDLGDGYMLHGTPYQHTVGAAVTHGCVRLLDGDIEWLYHNVPIGTRVYIY